jgi:hypothetical protein
MKKEAKKSQQTENISLVYKDLTVRTIAEPSNGKSGIFLGNACPIALLKNTGAVLSQWY